MSGSLRLNGGTSGFSEITAPDVAGDQTFTLPAVGGNLVVYQQGLWTPTLTYGTIGSPVANWIRIGNRVELYASITDLSDSTTNQPIQVNGAPYNRTTAPFAGQGATRVRYINFADYVSCSIVSSNGIRFNESINGDISDSVNYANIVTGNKDEAQLMFTVSYLTDDTTWVPINGATIS